MRKKKAELSLRPKEEVLRSSGIGGSEIAALVGLNPYKSPFDIWLEKTGQAPPDIQSAPAYWGKKLESVIADEYERQRGVLLVRCFTEPMRHPERPWQIGSPDCIVPSAKLDVEIKAPGLRQASRYGPIGTDIVPDEHFLQGQWYLSLLDYETCELAVLLGGQDFRIYTIKRDRDLEEMLLAKAEEFWTKHVLAGTPPEITDTERARDFLRRTFPKNVVPIRAATIEECELVKLYQSERRIAETHDRIAANIEARLKLAIGDAAGLEGDGFRINYKAAKDSEITDWKSLAGCYEVALKLIASAPGQQFEDARRVALNAVNEKAKYVSTRAGSRRFLPSFEGEKGEAE